MSALDAALLDHRHQLLACCLCPNMIRPVVACLPVASKIMLIGQAPGDREGGLGRPFAWTAGKTLFNWFAQIGLDEATFRQKVYIAAVCRCFPGKNPKGGDRVPDAAEIQRCSTWLKAEVTLLQPDLIIPVGKLAIQQLLKVSKLTDVVGQSHQSTYHDRPVTVIALPHPSGLSTWHRTEPGISLLQTALAAIAQHPAWQALLVPSIP